MTGMVIAVALGVVLAHILLAILPIPGKTA